jgi:dTDP-4-amino-4,6-dideoxygalactose transaminase
MKTISYGKQHIDRSDILAITKAAKSNLITTGKYVRKLENFVKKKFKVKYVISCSSGTAGLHLAFLSIGLKKNDVVLMPAVNFIASYNMCKLIGAKIYLVDIDINTGQVTPKKITECIKINKIKKVKLIVTMYLGGYPENVLKFYNLKKKLKCFLIEDACHALGAKYKNQKIYYNVGQCAHSDLCVFSLHPLKTITAGEGGIVTTNNKKFYNKLYNLRSHGIKRHFTKHWTYQICDVGYNYRISDINCALALSQFQKINKFIARRKKIYSLYLKIFKNFSYIKILNYNLDIRPSYHLIIIKINTSLNKISVVKNNLIKFLKNNKIFAQYHYIPIYKFNHFKEKMILLNSEDYFKSALSLPIYFDLKDNEVKRIARLIKKFFLKKIYAK